MEKFTSQTYMYISLTGLSLGAIVATDFPQTTIYDRQCSHQAVALRDSRKKN